MRRKNEYDQSKLTQVATNKAVVSAYVDAFPIEQVQLRFAEFANAKDVIDIYLSFEDALRVVQDMKTGKLIQAIRLAQYPLQISFGGTNKEGKVESRSMTIGLQEDKEDPTKTKIYVNAQKGPGKTTSTGAIIPAGQPARKISVGMSINDFKGMFLYIEAAINAYLPYLVKDLVHAAEEQRKKYQQGA